MKPFGIAGNKSIKLRLNSISFCFDSWLNSVTEDIQSMNEIQKQKLDWMAVIDWVIKLKSIQQTFI